jgi:hypothetical protein
MAEDTATSSSLGTSSLSAGQSPSPSVPSKERIDEVYNTLYDSVKVVGVYECQDHPQKHVCSRSASLKTLTPPAVHYYKTKYLIGIWDVTLLGENAHAFVYRGDQASHHEFTQKMGMTPKHWAREFIKENKVIKGLFEPSGRLENTIKALCEYWVVKITEWLGKYGTQKAAAAAVLVEGHPVVDDQVSLKLQSLDMMEDLPTMGGVMDTYEIKFGPPGHECEILLLPFKAKGGEFGVEMVGAKRCHKPCATMTDDNLTAAVEHLSYELAKMKGGLSEGPYQFVTSMEAGVAADGGEGEEKTSLTKGHKKMPDASQSGEMNQTYIYKFGPPGHECKVVILPHMPTNGKWMVETVSMHKCHHPCEVMTDERLEQSIDRAHQELFTHATGIEVPLEALEHGDKMEDAA